MLHTFFQPRSIWMMSGWTKLYSFEEYFILDEMRYSGRICSSNNIHAQRHNNASAKQNKWYEMDMFIINCSQIGWVNGKMDLECLQYSKHVLMKWFVIINWEDQNMIMFVLFLWKRILSSGGLFSVESMPGKAAATLRNNWNRRMVFHVRLNNYGDRSNYLFHWRSIWCRFRYSSQHGCNNPFLPWLKCVQ